MTPPTPRHADQQAELSHASTGELVTRLSTQLSELVRAELDLARTELAEKGKRARTGAGLMSAGGVAALYGLGTLIAAVVAALALVWPVWLGALVVGVVIVLVAGGLALAGRSELRKAVPPAPEKTVRSVREDVATVKEAVKR